MDYELVRVFHLNVTQSTIKLRHRTRKTCIEAKKGVSVIRNVDDFH